MLLVARGQPRIDALGAGLVRVRGHPAGIRVQHARLDHLALEARSRGLSGRLGRG
jgi:hypothetical protein